MADYLAIRAGQYAYLHRLIEQYRGGDQSLALLPNFAFSQALARWHQEQQVVVRGKQVGRSGGGGVSLHVLP
jgi:hypothetical protein